MNFRYLIASLVSLAVMTGINSNAPGEILYVGDSNDTVRRYDAQTGAFLDGPPQGTVAKGVFVTPGVGGLSGPRGMTLLGGPLLVINQNVAHDLSSAILRFNSQNGGLKKAIVPARYLPIRTRTQMFHLPRGAPWSFGQKRFYSCPIGTGRTWSVRRTCQPVGW